VQLTGFANRILSGILETDTSYYLPESEIEENKVGFREYRFFYEGLERGKIRL